MIKNILLLGVLSILSINGVNAQTYCAASGPPCGTEFNSWISTVKLGNFLNRSDCGDGDSLSPGYIGYTDFTSLGPIVLAPEAIEVLTVTPGQPNIDDICIAYIDWDDNGSFEEPGEEVVFTSGNPGASTSDYQGQIIVPAGVDTLQLFRLRIRTYEPAFEFGNIVNSCNPSSYGETEDYHIKISSVIPPPPTESDYCSASGPACYTANNSFIKQVDINSNGFTNSSDCADGDTLSLGYSDFSDLVVNMDIGASYLITVTPDNADPSGDYCEMYIDWNNDKSFDETTEIITISEGNPGSLPNGVYIGSATVPNDAITTDIIRLRIRTFYRTIPSANPMGPCGTTAYGEVEDYSIQVIDPNLPQCTEAHIPSDAAINICTNTTLSWTSPSGGATPTGYKLYLGTDYPPTDVHNGVDVGLDTFKVMQGLMPATTYYWRAVTYSANGDAQFCDTLEFTTNPFANPTIDIMANGAFPDSTTICAGVDLLLSGVVNGGAGQDSYLWSGNIERIPGFVTSANATYSSPYTNKTDTLIISMQDSSGCSATDTIKVFAKPSPNMGVVMSDQTVCTGSFVDVSIAGHTGDVQWQDSTQTSGVWNDINTAVSSNENFGPMFDTTYYRVVLDLDGCSDTTNQVKIGLFDPTAKPDVIASQNPFCEGDTVTLSTNNLNDNLWSTGETTQLISVSDGGDYFVIFTDQNNCSASSDTLTLIENPKPAAPFISQSGDTLFSNPQIGIQWFNENDGLIVGANDGFYLPQDTTSQDYYATFTDVNNCESDPSNIVLYKSTVGIHEFIFADFKLMPNPANENVIVVSSGNVEQITLYSISGKEIPVQVTTNTPNERVINTSDIPNGMYMVVVKTNQQQQNIRLLIQH